MRRPFYAAAVAGVLLFLQVRAEEQAHFTVLGSNTFGPSPVPVEPAPQPSAAIISVRAMKRLMHEDSFPTPGGGRLPAAFILRRAGNTNEMITVSFELTGTATPEVDYARYIIDPPERQPTVSTGAVQNVIFAPGERLQYVQFQLTQDTDFERFETIRLKILSMATLHGAVLPIYRPGVRRCASIWITDLPACVRAISFPNGSHRCVEYRPIILPRQFFIPDYCR